MTAARRWACVGLGVLLLVATPVLVQALPASDRHVDAVTLLHRIQAADDVPFSGYVESAGTIALPDEDELSSVANLLGQRTRMRVWWRGSDDWRVATLRTTGETDLMHAADRTTRWVYESKNVTITPDVPVRLPNSSDVLPNVLARRVLADARPGEVSRIGAARVAGHDALGLRLTPADVQSSIDHVDVFADVHTDVPLRVVMYAKRRATPSLTTSFDQVSFDRPAASLTTFTPPPDATVRHDDTIDLASAADRYAGRIPPHRLAGLPSRRVRGAFSGSVGIYGRGPTVLIAIPIWSRYAGDLHSQLAKRPGSRQLPAGLVLGATPLHLLLTDPERSGDSWLLAGTVTRPALVRASEQLAAHPPGHR